VFPSRHWWFLVLLLIFAACAERASEIPVPASTTAATATPSPSATAVGGATDPEPTPAPLDLLASRLAIPALGIDSPVQVSEVVADTSPPTPGCPGTGGGGETLTLPEQGIATPRDSMEGLQNKAWIFGHSRWMSQPGLFFALQDVNLGDEVFVDGVDRKTGSPIVNRRFVVDSIYLTDIDSGTRLVEESVADLPSRALVLLQTSAREDGASKQWLLNQQKVEAKSRNLVAGDLNDPCKYLLLFVLARAA